MPNASATSIRLDEEELAKLDHLADLTGLSRSATIRQIIHHYLDTETSQRLLQLDEADYLQAMSDNLRAGRYARHGLALFPSDGDGKVLNPFKM